MDPYVYPETNVLRNLRHIRDAGQLSKFEAIATTRRTVELEHEPIQGRFDARHLQAIHHHIFQDVYEWAGAFRTVNISKSGDPFAFCEHIVSSLDQTFAELKRELHLVRQRPRPLRPAWRLLPWRDQRCSSVSRRQRTGAARAHQRAWSPQWIDDRLEAGLTGGDDRSFPPQPSHRQRRTGAASQEGPR